MSSRNGRARPAGRPPGADDHQVPQPGYRYGWSDAQAHSETDEKAALARCFVRHDFLVSDPGHPESHRLGDASILATNGSTQVEVVAEAVKWMGENWTRGPFHIMWYTPAARVATELKTFKSDFPEYRSAAGQFLFPGPVDPEMECVLGDIPVRFANQELGRTRFTYAILSVHRFDLHTGEAYFHFQHELGLQKACARLFAAHKFLFLTPKKLGPLEGQPGYTLRDLLETSESVTLFTVAPKDRKAAASFKEDVSGQFEALRRHVLPAPPRSPRALRPHGAARVPAPKKSLRLVIADVTNAEPIYYDRSFSGHLCPTEPGGEDGRGR